ncbi:hypothetical protein MmiHf6_15630 [Methanimicrococcus hongohii]|uniref:Glycerophosphoryl diester phosphodiesterase membrane domain-containing protein n=1 Tax=Methanimicrococcus hongohii TaxID=3028295 RepID=A0AA97A2M5_9EURY|nr:hypothetical protein [Methanimicrococcus sp. Hf6]WNY24233.1 hypothetical protein MmiHf6_15630 [Methanimicrococcus sp. Hf6]
MGTVTESLSKAFGAFKDNWIVYIVAGLLVMVINLVLSWLLVFAGVFTIFGISDLSAASLTNLDLDAVSSTFEVTFNHLANGDIQAVGVMALLGALGVFLIGLLVMIPLTYGMYYMAIKGTRNEKVEIRDLFYAFSSGREYIRSITYAVLWAVILIIIGIVAALCFMLNYWVGLIVGILLYILVSVFWFFTLYIYIMTPSEGIVYAIKRSFNNAKSNLVSTVITVILVAILTSIPLLSIILEPYAYIYAAYVLKDIDPTLVDSSGHHN